MKKTILLVQIFLLAVSISSAQDGSLGVRVIFECGEKGDQPGQFNRPMAVSSDAYGNIYYCAVESKPLGNILNESGEKIFFNKNNLKYRHSIIKNKCKRCIHDYNGKNYLINEYKFHYYSKNL